MLDERTRYVEVEFHVKEARDGSYDLICGQVR